MFPEKLGFCSKLKRMIAQEDFISHYFCCSTSILFDSGLLCLQYSHSNQDRIPLMHYIKLSSLSISRNDLVKCRRSAVLVIEMCGGHIFRSNKCIMLGRCQKLTLCYVQHV
jgi:hypothetical protein